VALTDWRKSPTRATSQASIERSIGNRHHSAPLPHELVHPFDVRCTKKRVWLVDLMVWQTTGKVPFASSLSSVGTHNIADVALIECRTDSEGRTSQTRTQCQ
jgi:hypothetical protein